MEARRTAIFFRRLSSTITGRVVRLRLFAKPIIPSTERGAPASSIPEVQQKCAGRAWSPAKMA